MALNQPQPWSAVAQTLVDVAMGRQAAELVIQNGRWVNVYSGEIIPGTDIAITAGRIAYVGPSAEHTIGPETTLIAANGRYLVPGLCDGHMHVESGMITVTEFARGGHPPRLHQPLYRPPRNRQCPRPARGSPDA